MAAHLVPVAGALKGPEETRVKVAMTDVLGPDSLTWKHFGDLRTSLFGMYVVAMQNMYPSAAVC